MRVLYLTNIPSPYRVEFFDELGKLCELTVLYERVYAKNRDKKWKSFKEVSFNEVYLRGKSIGNDTAICFSVLKYLKSNCYDLIVIGGYSTPTGMLAIKYLQAKKIPFLLNCDGGIIKDDSKFKKAIKTGFISSASAWLSTGAKTSEYLLHYGAKEEKIFNYPFTSLKKKDLLTKRVSAEEKLRIKDKLNIKEEKLVVSVGQFIERKGFDILLQASKDLNNSIGVLIIGGEPTKEYIELKDRLKVKNVYFLGFKTKEELKEYYKAADLFVLPTREDIWGLVINEAMAYGLPVITTDKCIAGLELVNSYDNGFIVRADNPIELAANMNLILFNNELRDNMSDKSLEKISDYTIEVMAKRHVEIFDKLI